MLISSFQPSRILILLLASCFIWIGAIALAIVCFMGTTVTTGWIIAGALLVALAVWVIVMAGEIRNAVNHSDHFEPERTVPVPTPDEESGLFMASGSEPKNARAEEPVIHARRVALRFRSRSRTGFSLPRGPAAGR
ncbi:MAG: hypothetical protein ABIT37_24635 [Luteolibacter sp.]